MNVFARVTTSLTPRETFDEAADRFRTLSVPIVLSRPGLIELLVLASRSTGRFLTVSLWQSEESRHATSSDPAILSNIASFGALIGGTFTRDAYDVLDDTWDRSLPTPGTDWGFVRVTTAQLNAGAWDDGVSFLRSIAARPAGDPPDYAGSLVMADPLSGKVCVIETWHSRSALASYEETVYRHDRLARERQMLAAAPSHEVLRVMLVTRPDIPTDVSG